MGERPRLVFPPSALCPPPRFNCPCPCTCTCPRAAPRPAAFYKEAPWFVKMGVLLLWERTKGRASPVWGYVEQLPTSIDTPVRWSDAELAELQYAPAIGEARAMPGCALCWGGAGAGAGAGAGMPTTPAAPSVPQIQHQRAAWRQQYDAFVKAAGAAGGPGASWDDFLWALENVRSRAFSGPYTGSSGEALCRVVG